MFDTSTERSRRGVYGISVASELSGFGTQALRLYEHYGLVSPARTSGGTRRYSDHDLARLRRIAELIEVGVNLVGIGFVLRLESRADELERENNRLAADNARLRELAEACAVHGDSASGNSTSGDRGE
ncbi:MAG: MerR family transcriptional regulator [Rhodococcus sp. (in: high G+C Gram-positive bacteria)]|uniref:MerR family transcriptional regulator n=1 Tax=Rhodococcus sp. TaxID=1831 RepID=UPI003BB11169